VLTKTRQPQVNSWKLKLSAAKTVSAVFHLKNIEGKLELKVNHGNETLHLCSKPKYLRVTLDRTIKYRRHLQSLRKKLTSHIALLRLLSWFSLGCWSNNFANSHLTLVH